MLGKCKVSCSNPNMLDAQAILTMLKRAQMDQGHAKVNARGHSMFQQLKNLRQMELIPSVLTKIVLRKVAQRLSQHKMVFIKPLVKIHTTE